jgi:hypothetical protein
LSDEAIDVIVDFFARVPTAKPAYVNYLGGDEGTGGLTAAHSAAKLARLATLKLKYDPTNVFRMNLNIAPASVVSRKM